MLKAFLIDLLSGRLKELSPKTKTILNKKRNLILILHYKLIIITSHLEKDK